MNFKVLKNPVTIIETNPKSLLFDSISIGKEFGLSDLENPPTHYNGFSPKFQMVVGYYQNRFDIEGVSREGGFILTTKCLVIKDKGRNILIDSKQKVKDYFLPINNKYEALSFMTLVTNSYPIYDFGFIKRNFRINKPILNKTYVDSLSNGYEVHLFEHPIFSCSHPYSEITYKVDSLGDFKIIKNEELFFDPKEDGLCID